MILTIFWSFFDPLKKKFYKKNLNYGFTYLGQFIIHNSKPKFDLICENLINLPKMDLFWQMRKRGCFNLSTYIQKSSYIQYAQVTLVWKVKIEP